MMFLYHVVVYSVATLFSVFDKCLTYIVIQLMPIDEEKFCGAVTYSYTIVSLSHPPSRDPVYPMSQTIQNITGLSGNTFYSITVFALRNGNELYNTTMIDLTLESLSKYVFTIHVDVIQSNYV